MNKPGDLIYVPSSAPILCRDLEDNLKWTVLYLDKPGYYVVCEHQDVFEDWMDGEAVTILYNGRTARVQNKYIKKEF
jgi:hypothetical protein